MSAPQRGLSDHEQRMTYRSKVSHMPQGTLLLLLLASAACAGAPVTLHVAPVGNDANPGTAEKPFATMVGARDAIRAMKRSGPLPAAVEVLLAPGLYSVAEPIVFTPEDSGTAQAPIVYRGIDEPQWPRGPRAVISGGRRIEGWKRQGAEFVAVVPQVASGDWYFTQLYVNGHRRTRARGPNSGAYFRPTRALPGSDARWGLIYAADEFKPWDNLRDVVVVIFSSWFTTTHYIDTLNPNTKTVRFTAPGKRNFDQYEPNPRYYIENVREYLDEPGEWFLDRAKGTLHYLPLPGETPEGLEVFAPALRLPPTEPGQRMGQLLHFQGDPEAGRCVEHLEFRNLAFRHTDAMLRRDVSGSGQAGVGHDAALYARGLCHCLFESIEVAHTGEHAVFLHDGCCHNTIRKCHLHDLGGGGILAGGNWRWGKGRPSYAGITRIEDAPPPVTGNVFENNYIHDGGNVFHGIHGIWLGHASRHRIAHNEISDLPYSGISAGWDWSGKESTAHHNSIEKNHIHRIGLGMLNDMAGIYTLGDSPGTVIRHNLIHEVRSYESPVSYVMAAGIYMDMSSGHIRVCENVAYDVLNCGFFYHRVKAIQCENNVFARFHHGARDPRQPDDACVWAMFEENRGQTGSVFRHNIVYGDVPSLFMLRVQASTSGDPPPVQIEENWYRVAQGGEPRCAIQSGKDRKPVSWAEWQAAGQDAGSRIGEPGFVDPSRNDWRLRADAPARQLGIASIDLSDVGLTGEPAWRAMPRSFSARKADARTTYKPAPPPPLKLDEDYEDVKPGYVPEGAKGPIAVIARPGTSGTQVLRFGDRPGLERPWWPIREYSDLDFAEGTVLLAFDFLIPAKSPAAFHVELRDWRGELKAGPRVDLLADGQLRAGKFAAPVPLEKWCHLQITFALGSSATGQYTLRLECPGQEPVQRQIPFANRAFERLTWLGLLMPGEKPGAFLMDNLKFEVRPPER